MSDLQANVLMLSGNPADGAKIRGHRFSRLPAGRAQFLGDSDTAEHLQLVDPLTHVHSTSENRSGKDYSS